MRAHPAVELIQAVMLAGPMKAIETMEMIAAIEDSGRALTPDELAAVDDCFDALDGQDAEVITGEDVERESRRAWRQMGGC